MQATNRNTLTERIEDGRITRGLVAGGVYTAGGRAVALLVQVIVGIVQARYLTPSDFGLFGMVTTITSFTIIFKELGLSYATIQTQDINYEQVNALFWVNALVGTILTCATAASAWPIAAFYKTRAVVPLTLAMSTVFLLSGISVQHAAILKRKMRFREMAVADVGSAILGALVGLLLVLQGVGVWALVLMQIVKWLAYNLLVWGYLPWMPSRPRAEAGIRSLVTFGGNIMAFDFVNYFSKNVDRILIGRYYGAGILGFYSKALELITLPITQIRGPLTVVGIPALSALQEDGPRFSRHFIAITEINAALCVPAMLWLSAGADFLVPLLLGHQWIDAIPYFRWLAAAGVFQSAVGILGTMLIASGNSKRYLIWGLWHGAAMALCYASILFTTPLTMVKLFLVVNAAVFVPSAYFCSYGTWVKARDFLWAHAMPFGFGGLGLLGWWAGGRLLGTPDHIITFAARTSLFMVVALGWLGFRWKKYWAVLRRR